MRPPLFFRRPVQKVFGIGLHRTGTTSLTEALRILGFKSVHYPYAVFRSESAGCVLETKQAARFDAITDLPAARFYRELDEAFPGSKFILTVRDEESWLRSMRRLRHWHPLFAHFFPKVDALAVEMFGASRYDDEAELLRRYRTHNDAVRAYFSGKHAKDLLVLDVSDRRAWRTLCAFLGKRRPRLPFPKHNQGYSSTFRNLFDFLGSGA
jgi:hypothetical protein